MKESVRREMELFKLSSHVNETLVDVSQRIGFTNVMPYGKYLALNVGIPY